MQDEPNTQWDDSVPDTSRAAKPTAWRAVTDCVVIHVTKATIRSTQIEDAWFELHESDKAFGTYAGRPRAEVKCLWFGRKPPTSWMHITLLGPHEVVRDYTGEVVADIGLKTKPVIK